MESDIVYKTCSKCKETKPVGEFHKNRSRVDGYAHRCKLCVKQYQIDNAKAIAKYNKQYQIDNAKAIAENKKQYRIDNAKAIKQYRIDNAKAIAENKKQYRIDNAKAIAEYKKQYQIDNAKAIAENNKQYRIDNATAIAEYKKQYQIDNAKAIAEREKQYFKSPSGRKAGKAARQNRRARKKKAEGRITKIVIQQIEESNILKYGELTCVYCGVVVHNNYHLEHKIPLARGGDNTIENLTITCPTCNMRKHTRTDEEFLVLLQEENTKGDKK